MKPYALTVVAPYRDREAHLSRFIPHMLAYFRSPPGRLEGRVLISIVQQEPGKSFNRGKLLNIGFAMAEAQSVAVCFHDVDFLPLEADYRPPESGWITLLAGGFTQVYEEFEIKQPETVFGGVTLFANADFRRINGFSNEYWGWGFEDMDLAVRSTLENVPFGRRHGRFEMLSHKNAGFAKSEAGDFVVSDAHARNKGIFARRFPEGATPEILKATSQYREDGLSSLDHRVIAHVKAAEYSNANADLEIVTVSV